MSTSPLSRLSRHELAFLRKAIKRRQIPTPISEMALQSVGRGKLYPRLGPLAGAGEEAALALIDMALGHAGAGQEPEAGAAAGPGLAPGEAAPAAALVWTGPEVPMSRARPTTPMVLELFASARQRVLVAGYEFDHGAVLFEPLHRVMQEHGVEAAVYLDIPPAPSPRTRMDAYLALQGHRFLKQNWPFGAPFPALYYLPAGAAHGSRQSLHAKCVVVDGRHVLVGSANFTRRGHTRNLEVGVRLEDAALATALASQLERLVEQGALAHLPAGPSRELPPDAVEDEEEAEAQPSAAAAGSAAAAAAASGSASASGSGQLAEELYVSADARPLFVRLLDAGLPAPRVGEDIEGEDGAVIGSPELSWPAQRVAVLLPEQEGSRKQLEAAGWTCFALAGPDSGAEEFDALCALVGRAE